MRQRAVFAGKLLIVLLLVLWTVVPVGWIILNSFKSGAEITAYPPKFIFQPTLKNYFSVFQDPGFQRTFLNSFIVAVSNVLLVMIVGTLSAYGFSRFEVKGKKHILFWIISTRMFPPVVASVPFFIIFKNLGMLDTRFALIIAYITFNLPFVVWMMKGFFDEVPIELEECAKVDGANTFQAFFRVALPIVAPGLAATSIFTFILSWNEFLFALILVGRNAKTLPVHITEYLRWGEGIFWGDISATASVMLIPVLILALSVQRHLIRGMTFGAVKG